MCGIAGYFRFDGAQAESAPLLDMIGQLRHRGPDDDGCFTQGPMGIAHARLSIVDLAGGHQPMASHDRALWIVFNGEIFNHIELREQLRSKGHRFHTNSDTEVILEAFRDKGERCVEDFNGQWAFAIWEPARQRLFLSRDRLGVRPLFYHRDSARLAFASEIKSILSLPGMLRELDVQALDQMLTFWSVVPPRTMFEGVQELPPGHSMVVDGSGVRTWAYWALDYQPDEAASESEHAGRLLEALIDAARVRLRADVPVGAYLSGGLDSTVVAAIVKRYTNARLKTFSVTFEDPEFDESSFQRQAARFLEVEHHQVQCTAADIGRVFPSVVWHAEAPMVRTAPAPLYLLSRLVRDNDYKVVLTGEGSDELLGGYDIFKEAKIRRFCGRQPQSSRRPALLRRLYPYMPALHAQPSEWLASFFQVTPEALQSPFFSHLPRWELTSRTKLFLSKQYQERLRGVQAQQAILRELPDGYQRWDDFSRAQYLESRYLLPGYLLSTQGDRVAMANSVEGRYPFLDHRVVEVASRIPARLKMKVLDEKYILKVAARELIPPFLRRRPKQPYRAPDVDCFFDTRRQRARFRYVDEMLSPDAVARAGMFNPDAVGRLADKARTGRVVGAKDGMALVAILSAQLLAHQFLFHVGRHADGTTVD
jgi:asparagine synthase (glutamine-hydrolysing)